MRRALLGLTALSVVVLSGCGGGAQARSRLIFSDEFRGDTLAHKRWNTCHWWAERGCTIGSNSELEWYLPEQVRAGQGKLRLVADRRTVRGADGREYPYVSGMVSSGPPYDSRRARFAFRYGRAEIRAKVPAGKGLWSAFWLLPAARVSRPEIDVMEILGHAPQTVEMHAHYRDGRGRERDRGTEWSGLTPGWHRFAVDWNSERVVWLVDGKERWRVRGDAVPHVPLYLVLNLAVGGEWPGSPTEETPFPSALEVDYVKVWK